MHVKLMRKKKNKDRLLALSLFLIILISSVYMYNLLFMNYEQTKKMVDFKVYQSQYKQSDEQIIVWLDQNGTLPCTGVKVMVHPSYEWSFDEVHPEQFIKLTFPKKLNVTNDIPFFQEIFVEFEYLDENIEKNEDKILWIIIDHNDIL